uniref:Uncharacterized protein n=1 Tax=Rhizophora mucronata TaxID=61149 RepID=A0A2P2Q0J9_RHIMU
MIEKGKRSFKRCISFPFSLLC